MHYHGSVPSSGAQRSLMIRAGQRRVAAGGGRDGVRRDLEAIYAVHNPEKLGDIEHMMKKYRGRERQLIEAVRRKYKC